jgi:hypothetical protein
MIVGSARQTVATLVLVVVIAVTAPLTHAQMSPDWDPGSDEEADSVQALQWDYLFPLYADKVLERGFELPYPGGINLNYFMIRQNILLSNVAIGFDPNDLVLLDFVSFEAARSEAWNVNIRPDLWLFPFLNVYGIFGRTHSTTRVVLAEPIRFESEVDFEGWTYGGGATTAFGLRTFWGSFDVNWTQSNLDKLTKNLNVLNFGMRVGKTFHFDRVKNVTFWLGAFHTGLEQETSGVVTLSDVFPDDLMDLLGDYQNSEWYQELTPPQKEIVDEVVDKFQSQSSDGLYYSVDKAPEQEWHWLAGTNLEFTKHWFARAEVGFARTKWSLLLNINYRFHL